MSGVARVLPLKERARFGLSRIAALVAGTGASTSP